MSDIYLSKEKVAELKNELHELKTSKRRDIAERLKKAKEFGDLSENFEYAQAKEDQEKLERDIAQLENIIKNSHIITKSKNKNTVSVGLTVTLSDDKKIKSAYTLVGSQEADPMSNKISNASPLGKALLGKQVGDEVKVVTPKGSVRVYSILKIE